MTQNARSTTQNRRVNTPLGRVTRKFRVVLTGGRSPPPSTTACCPTDSWSAPRPVADVRVPFGRLDAIVPQQLLDVADVYPIFEQMGDERVAQGVGVYAENEEWWAR